MPETCIRFGELGARVMIEDKEVQHYAMQVDPAKKEVSCWIASEEGKAFSVVWLGSNFEYPSGVGLHLDGHHAQTFLRPSRNAAPVVFQYTSISESSCLPFLFSPLVVTDDDTYLDTSPSHSFGEIKLVVVRTTAHEVAAKEQHTYPSPPHMQKVHERSKKAIAHRVNYGSEIPRPPTTTCSTKFVERIVTFIFKYRPLEMLRANDIAPRNPEPLEPQEHALNTLPTSETSSGKGEHSKVEKEESGSEDEDSMKEKALLAEVERIRKRRQEKDSKRPKKKLKNEDMPSFIPGEVIDLT